MISILLVDLWITKTFQNCTLTQDTLRRQSWYMWNWSLSIPSIELLDISVYLGVLSQCKLHKLKRSSKELTVDAPDQLTDCIIWTNWSASAIRCSLVAYWTRQEQGLHKRRGRNCEGLHFLLCQKRIPGLGGRDCVVWSVTLCAEKAHTLTRHQPQPP